MAKHNIAVFWIRDGVLIDRMPVNAVAFAVASLACADVLTNKRPSLASLVNFAFEASGISCADKMRKFNSERQELINDVESASSYYNQLAVGAGRRCVYFNGARELVKELHDLEINNFITSAIDQPILDDWAASEQGQVVAPFMTEILGKRGEGFNKGRDHFAYAREMHGAENIFLVADAVAEIATAAKCANEFNIMSIGFVPPLTTANIRDAHALVLEQHARLSEHPDIDLELDESKLDLPSPAGLVKAMREYTDNIVQSAATTIIQDLRTRLATFSAFQITR